MRVCAMAEGAASGAGTREHAECRSGDGLLLCSGERELAGTSERRAQGCHSSTAQRRMLHAVSWDSDAGQQLPGTRTRQHAWTSTTPSLSLHIL